MTVTISNAACRAMVDALTAMLDGGTVEIRSGTRPAQVEDTPTGTVLADFALDTPAFPPAVDVGVVAQTQLSAPLQDLVANDSGTASWFRAYSSGGDGVMDGTITLSTQGGDMIVNKLAFVAGAEVDITSWAITLSEGA